MPEHREDRNFGTRYVVRNVACLPGLILFGIACIRIMDTMTLDLVSSLMLAGSLTFIIWFMVYEHKRFRNYHCPQCKAHISKPTATEQRIEYYCAHYDIIWDKMLRNGGE